MSRYATLSRKRKNNSNSVNPSIQSKLPAAGTTIFTVMSSLAARHQAINLGQGFPDFPMSDTLVDLVCRAMRDGHNQYVHMNGYLPLREALAAKASLLYQRELDPGANITITPGATYALYTALTTVLQPGDEVIFFEPAYDSYLPTILLNGATPVPVSLSLPHYHINWQEVKEKITKNTRAIIINSPHNPTGSVLGPADLDQLADLVRGSNIIVISDEVYEHLIFDGLKHQSVLKHPELFQRSFACFSFGKVYHCTGWKLGYCMAPAPLMEEFRKIHQFNAFTCDSPKQVALAGFLQDADAYLSLGMKMEEKRNYFQQLMQDTSFRPLPTHGSYFQIYSYENLSAENEKDFAVRLTKDAGVATIPVSAFYKNETNNQVLRFCFAKREQTLAAAVERLLRWEQAKNVSN